jgi:hypothetical protein
MPHFDKLLQKNWPNKPIDDLTPAPMPHPTFTGRIALARRDITPPPGIYARMWGAAKHDTAQGVHRPLTATAMAIFNDRGPAPLLLIAVDLGWFRAPSDADLLRRPLLQQLNLDSARLMLCLSHTHAGPSISPADASQPGGHLIVPYIRHVADQLVAAAQEAVASAQPAALDWHYGRGELASNRDLVDPADPSRFLVGFNPAGQADDTLLVARAAAADGRPLGTIVNYACHPTTLAWENVLISPDYVGAMREVIESATAGAPCLFLQGASGELAPAEQYTGDPSVPDRHGRRLGHAALAALNAMNPPARQLAFEGAVESGAPLALWRNHPAQTSQILSATEINVPLPLKPQPSLESLQQQHDTTPDRVTQERLRRKLRILRDIGTGPTCSMPAWIWRIGDTLLIGHPNEAYSLLQITLRQKSPAPVAVMNIVNTSCGYLTPPDLHTPGLYAAWQSPFAPEALNVLIDHCVAAITTFVMD